jgi:branched-chain amino acid transport system ATP-binding protein
MSGAHLLVRDLVAAYGRARVLFGVSLEVRPGEVVVLLGRNGAGKSTTLKSIVGLLRPVSGSVRLDEAEIAGVPAYRAARLGIGYVPEDRRIFPDLSVVENLEVGKRPPRHGAETWTADSLMQLFPNLAGAGDRPAGRLSGGEQQMLAIARTLMGHPRLLLLDEPSEGLAPVIVEQLGRAIQRLKASGVGMLLCEQNARFARAVADRGYVIETGRIRAEIDAADLAAGKALEIAGLAL